MNALRSDRRGLRDLLLIVALVGICLIGLLLAFLLRTEGSYCVVTRDGKELGRYSLTEDRKITFYSGEGDSEYNTVVIENRRVYVSAASCPDKICEKSRAIRYHGETVVCLPHGLVITVYGGEGDFDIIV